MPFELPTPQPLPIFETGLPIINMENQFDTERSQRLNQLIDTIPQTLGQLGKMRSSRNLAELFQRNIPEFKPRPFSTARLKEDDPDLYQQLLSGKVEPSKVGDIFDKREKQRTDSLAVSAASDPTVVSKIFKEYAEVLSTKAKAQIIAEMRKAQFASATAMLTQKETRLRFLEKETGSTRGKVLNATDPQRYNEFLSERAQLRQQLGKPQIGPQQAQPAKPGNIRVRINATGQSGTIDAKEFDENTMQRL